MKKFLSTFLVICVFITMCPINIFAANKMPPYSLQYLSEIETAQYKKYFDLEDIRGEDFICSRRTLEVYDTLDSWIKNDTAWEPGIKPFRDAFKNAGFKENVRKDSYGQNEYWYMLKDSAENFETFIINGEKASQAILNEGALVYIEHDYIIMNYDSGYSDESDDSIKKHGLSNFTKSVSYAENQFKDVSDSKWYYSAVRTAFELGLMKGNSNATFNTSGNITIAETLALACRMHKIYNGNKDEIQQGTPWYQAYVEYALENGIITTNQFTNYTAPATRADFATIIAAAFPESALSAINSVKNIPDVPSGASYSKAVYLLYNAGVLSGNDEFGTFNPNSNITRSEVAAIATRMAVVNERKSFELKIDCSNYVISDFQRRIKNKYSEAVATCGYGYQYKNLDGDVCVLTYVQYKIIDIHSVITLHNLTTGTVIDNPVSYYDGLAKRASGKDKMHLYDLSIEMMNNFLEMEKAAAEIMTTGNNPWKGVKVDLKYLNW